MWWIVCSHLISKEKKTLIYEEGNKMDQSVLAKYTDTTLQGTDWHLTKNNWRFWISIILHLSKQAGAKPIPTAHKLGTIPNGILLSVCLFTAGALRYTWQGTDWLVRITKCEHGNVFVLGAKQRGDVNSFVLSQLVISITQVITLSNMILFSITVEISTACRVSTFTDYREYQCVSAIRWQRLSHTHF